MAEGGQINLLRCFKCNSLSENENKYMPPCCGIKVMCQKCYGEKSRIYCGECRRISTPTRIRKEFFDNIREILFAGDEHGRRGNKKKRGAIKEMSVAEGAWQEGMRGNIHAFLDKYQHGRECKLYGNITFLCNTVFKLIPKLRDINDQVSIHDILAYQCLFCAHGEINHRTDEEGKIQILSHGMNECRRACCGAFLDRTTLQYLEGGCQCGVGVMQILGIRPATEKEHLWKLNLFKSNPSHYRKKRIVLFLNPFIAKMTIKKAQMLVWYLMSQGNGGLEEIEVMEKGEAEGYLWQIIGELNGEFSVHRPIQ